MNQELEKIFTATWQFGPDFPCFIGELIFGRNPVESFVFILSVPDFDYGVRFVFQCNLN